MAIEWILSLALLVALNELKEWRANSRMRQLERLVRALPAELKLASQTHEESLSFARKAHVELESLVRVIDSHGIRINYRDKSAEQADYVEGL